MLLFRSILFGLAAVTSLASAADDLGTVLENNRNLTTYYELIRRYPDILLQLPSSDGITIIAPSNAAFENIPYTALDSVWDPEDEETTIRMLQYHILHDTVTMAQLETGPTYMQRTLLTDSAYTNVTNGQNILINRQGGDVVIITSGMGTRCTVVERDIPFEGGMIQVIDNLLIVPTGLEDTTEAFSIPSFLGALYAADIMPSLATRRNITVFAPQDVALEAVGGTLQGLDAEELARVMGYHIVPGNVLASSSLTNGTSLRTLTEDNEDHAESVVIRQAGNNKYVNSAQIVQPDILLSNGILHIISNVLNPEADSVLPNPEVGTQSAVFLESTVSDPFTSAIPISTSHPATTSGTADSDANSDTTSNGSGDAAAETTSLSTRSSDGVAPARCTAQVAGAAVGVIGIGAGLAWI